MRSTRIGSALAVAFSSLGAAAGVCLWRLGSSFPGPRDAWFWVGYAAVLSVVTWLLAKRGVGGVEPYPAAILAEDPAHANMPWSLIWTTAFAIALMSLATVVLPSVFHGPRWVATETVIGAWWVGWGALFTLLLYRGGAPSARASSAQMVQDGSVSPPPRARSNVTWRKPRARQSAELRSATVRSPSVAPGKRLSGESNEGWLAALDLLGFVGELFPISLVFGALFLLAWLMVDLALPASFVLAYRLVCKSLDQVAHHGRACQGRPGRALVAGVFWATGYAMPFAMAVLLLHRLVRAF